MRIKKNKESKTRERVQLAKSTQNLVYMLEPSNANILNSMYTVIRQRDIDRIQITLQKQLDPEVNRHFLKTCHNRLKIEGQTMNNYRSPYTNKYYPECDSGVYPSPIIRNIEEKGAYLFGEYAKMYYGDCISNFFVEENEDYFCFAFYVQKVFDEDEVSGVWNSTNVAEIKVKPPKMEYKVTTSVIYELKDKQPSQFTSITGNLRKTKIDERQTLENMEIEQFHLMTIGKIVEENETCLRQQMEEVFARKTKEIIHNTRVLESKARETQGRNFCLDLIHSNSIQQPDEKFYIKSPSDDHPLNRVIESGQRVTDPTL